MKNFHIEIDIDKDGNMLICEDGCTGKHYHILGTLDDLIDQITIYLADYLRMEESNMTNEEYITNLNKIYEETGYVELPPTREKPNNIMSTDGELKQWQKDIMERNCIMSRAEMQEFLKPKNDPVNHPSHYTDGKIEVIDFIEDKNLNFHLANAVKYISRAGKKDPSKEIEDLKKARWYLDRYIQKLEEAPNGNEEGETEE